MVSDVQLLIAELHIVPPVMRDTPPGMHERLHTNFRIKLRHKNKYCTICQTHDGKPVLQIENAYR